MKKAIKLTLFVFGFCVFAVLACLLLPDPFGKAYQRNLMRQYDHYNSLADNKMVFLGSSSLSFGFDLDTMEELSGKPCAILGNHFGYGMTYLMEMSKPNLRAGDIVVIEMADNTIDKCGEDLLLTAIGHRYEMYRFFIPETRGKIISYYPSFLKKVLLYDLGGGYDPGVGPYSIDAFDARGNMIYQRDECEIPDPYVEDPARDFIFVHLTGTPFQTEYIDYINNYTAFCRSKGARVYITLPPCYRGALTSTEEEIAAYEQMLSSSFDAPLISRQADYIFDRDRLYDGIMHCNTEGAKYRTTLLYQDLVRAGAFD